MSETFYLRDVPASKEECIAEIKKDWMNLPHIWPQTESMIKAASKNWYHFQYPEEETVDRVKCDGRWLKEAKVQTPEIVDAALDQNGTALEFVWNKTRANCRKAVSNCWTAIRFDPFQEEETCLIGAKQHGAILKYIRPENQTPRVRMACISKYGMALYYCKNHTEDECLAGVKQSWRALQFCKVQTPKVIAEAIRQNKDAARFVRKK